MLIEENTKTEEWMGLWGFYLYYCGEIDRGGWADELWTRSYGSIEGVYGC